MKKYNLAKFIEQKMDDDAVEIELSDGSTVVVPSAVLWSDEIGGLLDADKIPEAAVLILGREAYDRFVASGGSWKLLNAIFADVEGADVGGIARLVELIAQHGEAIEADLARFYGLNLPVDLGTDRLTWRRLRVLLEHLPRESAYVQAVHGDRAMWGDTEHLLALIVDTLAISNWQRANTGKKRRTPFPKPIRRPGARDRNLKRIGTARKSIGEMRKILDRRKTRRR